MATDKGESADSGNGSRDTSKFLDMFEGNLSSGTARTRYVCATVERARKNRLKLRVVSHAGTPRLAPARLVHKSDLLAVFQANHPQAGQGKYLNHSAVSAEGIVRGADHINPFQGDDTCWATVLSWLQQDIGLDNLKRLSGFLSYSDADGHHIIWSGKRSRDQSLLVSPWRTADELWKRITRAHRTLASQLAASKSSQQRATNHLSAKAKFVANLDLMQRSTRVYNVAKKEFVERGGVTPIAKPLEQVGMAIDKAFLITGQDRKGHRKGQYHYRLAVGRPWPVLLPERDVRKMKPNSPLIFKDEETRMALCA